ncbi:MAG: nitroreductase [Sphingobacteriales bacterium BACL12 MAG-120802-bin5]|jgi:iodotyrosine deiodinase|nr:MAG: nitroreductase [Sphingobacteriales bacterium BACL12 MAG-120802-bin5]
MSKEGFIPYQRTRLSDREMIDRSLTFFNKMDKRRSVREFSDAPIADEVIDNIIRTASTAPSGAHKQPWTFCVVKDPEIKKAIRIAAEKEEKISYEQRMPQDWLDDLAPLGTDWHKPFLEIAPALIVVFKRNYEYLEDRKANNYYVSESVGLATGLLIAAIHNAGLVTLTHTPSPMNFLKEILQRPDNEKPFLLLPVGKPMEGTMVPKLERKPLSEVMVRY